MTASLSSASGRTVQRPRERRFRVYNVGIAKTGTQSVAGIFANYRALHELLFQDTVDAISRRARGDLTDAEFREFIRWRDQLTRLDVDSSSYNAFYADVLAQEFEDAKFIFVIRDCWSWLDSMVNMALRLSPTMQPWMVEHCRTILGSEFDPLLADDDEELQRRLPSLVKGGLTYWSSANRFVLEALPMERSLIVRTDALSNSLDQLATFVGVEVNTLRGDLRHVHRGDRRLKVKQAVDVSVWSGLYQSACAPLMDRFFPAIA